MLRVSPRDADVRTSLNLIQVIDGQKQASKGRPRVASCYS